MEFKDVLHKLIKQNRLTNAEVIKGAGISKSTLHGLLNGAEPEWKTVKKLAKFFKVSVSYMENGEELLNPITEILKIDVHKATYEVTVKRIVSNQEPKE